MSDAYIIACGRSAMTKAKKGSFANTRIDDIAADVLRGTLARVSGLDPADIEDVIIGCAMPEGEQGLNVARHISFLAGIPEVSGAVTLNRFCASSLDAIAQAARAAMCGDGELFVAGGIESMSHIPMTGFNPSYNERLMSEGMPDAYISMGLTAENVVKRYSISREDQDKFALMSHRKAVSAQQQGKFDREIVPVEATDAEGNTVTVEKDEMPRTDTSMEVLAKLKPAFVEGGSVTAGNSSPLTDGAAMTVVASKSYAKRIKAKPLARIRSMAVAGVAPDIMGTGPIAAVPKALKRAKMKLKDIDLIELNEAFAGQALSVVRELGMDEKKLNVNGGAIALGHPLGASGARIVTTLLHAMEASDAETGLATMCVGGGQGMALILERT